MPLWLIISLIGYSAVALPLALRLTETLSKHRSPLDGVWPAFFAALIGYTATALVAWFCGWWQGILVFFVTELPVLIPLGRYAVLRHRRFEKLSAAYREKKRASRPAIVAGVKMRRALKGFQTRSPLSIDAQHEVVILLKNGTDPQTLTAFYNCRESELLAIEKAFDAYIAAETPKTAGVDYTVLPHQREFLLRLMLTGTPASLSCGEGLLWQEKSVAALIEQAAGKLPSRDSVLRFLSEAGMLLDDGAYLFSETPEGLLWEKTQFEKIRMSALERSASIFWLFSLHAQDLPYTVLVATGPDFPNLFGVYKENSGLGDFLNKLSQMAPLLYVVTTFRLSDFKKFTTPPQNVTLFPYGERTDIPDR